MNYKEIINYLKEMKYVYILLFISYAFIYLYFYNGYFIPFIKEITLSISAFLFTVYSFSRDKFKVKFINFILLIACIFLLGSSTLIPSKNFFYNQVLDFSKDTSHMVNFKANQDHDYWLNVKFPTKGNLKKSDTKQIPLKIVVKSYNNEKIISATDMDFVEYEYKVYSGQASFSLSKNIDYQIFIITQKSPAHENTTLNISLSGQEVAKIIYHWFSFQLYLIYIFFVFLLISIHAILLKVFKKKID